MPDRIFCGVYPCGLVYADRHREKHGDYARLAFLSYRTLELELEKDCPAELVAEIQASAAGMQAKRGQPFQISTTGQSITLGQ